MINILDNIFDKKKPIIGMVHLRPLPGSPLYDPKKMDMNKIIEIAVKEAKTLEKAGVDGLQVENIWDFPYIKGEQIEHETTASLAVALNEVIKNVNIPVGVNCHFNGGEAALAAAIASQAKWVRVFEWSNSYISQVGFIDAIGGKLSRMRSKLKANDIIFLCDVNVKHGSHFIISDRSIPEQAKDIESQGGDAVIVTGFETGVPPTAEKIKECKDAVDLPVILGSGIEIYNAKELLRESDGAIVGSSFKKDGNWKNDIDFNKVVEFMSQVEELRGENK